MLTAVAAADPSLTADQIVVAFDTAVTTGAALRSLTAAFAADPHVLTAGAPAVVGRLVDALIAAGSTTLTAPTCVVCARTGRALTATTQGAMCTRCAARRSATACSRCGVVKPVAGRTGAGEALCERCRRHLRGHRRCGICANTATIVSRARDGRPDVCARCYRLPEAVCRQCGQTRPCHYANTDRAICKTCTPRATATCARCGHDRAPTARWPEGPVCEPCYRAALSRRGPCTSCGHTRRLVNPPDVGADRCADCAGIDLPGNHICHDCGREERLYQRGRCVRCAIQRRAAVLLRGTQPTIPDVLVPVYDAIVAARQPYTAANWLRDGAGAAILAEIADGRLATSHDALDAHPQRRAADYLRRMLVTHGVLPDRDEDLARTEQWTRELLATIKRPTDRRVVTAYATWRVLRRLRQRSEHNLGPWTATRAARTHLTAAAAFVAWLDQHNITLAAAGQGDIDRWLIRGPAAHDLRNFLRWARDHGHCQPLDIPPPVRRTGTTIEPEQRWDLLARLLHDNTLELTDRVAGALLLAYGQHLSRITAMTTDQITRTQAAVTVRFGNDHITVPEPLASLLRTHLDTPRSHLGIGSAATSPWLFPGHLPGRPLTPARLGDRLGKLGIDARAARRAALLQLGAELPAAVLAELLHLSPGAAVNWVNTAGGDWSRYAASLAAERIHQPVE